MSLVKLAEEGNLPLHQYMDFETLQWIIKNKPLFNSSSKLSYDSGRIRKIVKQFLPKREWFLLPEETDSIHGFRHITRVMVNTTFLTQDINTYIAASLHDLRRENDKGDLGHAERAADWFKSNIGIVERSFGVKLSKDSIEEIYFAIYFHEKPYSEIEDNPKYLKHKSIADILKTADALDRYRLPKLKWWINKEFIRLKPNDGLKEFAYNLVVSSEDSYLASHKSIESVINSIA